MGRRYTLNPDGSKNYLPEGDQLDVATHAAPPAKALSPEDTNWEGLKQFYFKPPPGGLLNFGYARPPTEAEKMGMSMFIGGSAAALGGAIAGPGLIPQALGQGGGTAFQEGFDYMTQPSATQPSPLGMGIRTAISAGAPLALGKLAESVAPLAQKMKPMLSEIPPIAKETFGKVGSAIKTVVRKGLGETTEARMAKDAMLADLEAKGARLPVEPVIQKLKEKFVPYAGEEMKGLIKGLQDAASGDSISLPKFQELIRAARQQARTPAAKQAFSAFNEEFKNSVAQEIATNPMGGETMAQEFLSSFNETASRLRIFEKMDKLVGNKQAINATKGLLFDDTSKAALKALDEEIGRATGSPGTFLSQIEELAKTTSAIEKRNLERGITAESNAALVAAQKRARAILYGLAGLIGGTITGGARGVLGGALGFGGGLGSGEIASWLMSRIVGQSGAILPERLAAQGLAGLSKATPYLAAPVSQAVSALEPPREEEPPVPPR